MKIHLVALLALAGFAGAAPAQLPTRIAQAQTHTNAAATPSVQVETVPLRQQPISETVTGYGVVTPAAASVRNLSLPRAGQVLQLWVSAGQVVGEGTPLLAFGTGADASLAYHQALQAVEFARGEAARIKTLLGQQLATRSQLAAAEKSLADARSSLQQQRRVGANQREERLLAPFDAIVIAVQAAQGDRVAAGAPLVQLAQAGRQRVRLGVEPADVRRIRTGMPVSVSDLTGPGSPTHGKVAAVFGMINPQTQLVDVVVDLDRGELLPGARVLGRIEIADEIASVVPRSAVLRDEKGAYLFQVSEGTARRIDVRTGVEDAGLIAVQGPLDPALPVVSVGNYELHDGMAVRGAGR